MSTEMNKLHQLISNKRILVTGGTGSIGSHLVEQIIKYHPKQLIILNKDDSKQFMMQQKLGSLPNVKFFLGDIRDLQTIDYVMRGIDIVFHAAALKQVPVCEENPFEAVKTNVIGSENVIRSAIIHKVQKVINISTDKAVNPTNTMGATKLISEKLFKQANFLVNNHCTCFSSVRFGNVIGSRGSVIPLFLEQVKAGEPITVTDPGMTRFIMSIPEAVKLTLMASVYSMGGEIFILKMKAFRMKDLITALKSYMFDKYQAQISVKHIGVRSGEKLYEELLTADEAQHVYENNALYVVNATNIAINLEEFQLANLSTYRSDSAQFISLKSLKNIIADYDN